MFKNTVLIVYNLFKD